MERKVLITLLWEVWLMARELLTILLKFGAQMETE